MNTKKILCTVFLIFGLLLTGCDRNLPKSDPINLTIIICKNNNSKNLISNNQLERDIIEAYTSLGNISVINADGDPSYKSAFYDIENLENSIKKFYDETTWRNRCLNPSKNEVMDYIQKCVPDDNEVDILAAIQKVNICFNEMESVNSSIEELTKKGVQNKLVIYSTGLSTNGEMSFLNDNLYDILFRTESSDERQKKIKMLCEKLQANSEIPKGIEGASVCWYGIGEVDGENQPKLKEKEKIILIEIWTEVLKQAGVTEIEFKECAVTEENNKFETTVTSIFPPNSIGQFISTPDFGGFNPGESTFADEEKAKLEFEAFSKKIKISGEPILIVGTTANDGVDEGIEKELSLKRANTVKTLLINFGVDSNDIMTVGAGNDPIWLDGSQLDIAQQHDRSVRIVSANSNEAIELLEKYG